MNSRTLWKVFTSLRLTVICLGCGVVLVFLGTLAQVNEGLYDAQSRWFKAFFIWVSAGGIRVPVFFGGYTIGLVLLANLLASHAKRFVWGWRKLGIHLTHFGVVLLLVGQLATDWFSKESFMSFREGQTLNYSEDHRDSELVFLSEAGNGEDRAVSFAEPILAKRKEILHESLPFVVRVKEYHTNADVLTHKEVLEAGGRLTTALATLASEFSTPEGLAPQAERARESEGRTQVWRDALKSIGETDVKDIVAAAGRISKEPERAARLEAELVGRFRKEMLTRFSQMPASERVSREQADSMHYAAQKIGRNELITEESVPSATSAGPGKDLMLLPLPEEKSMDERNMPAAVIEVVSNGQSAGEWVVWPGLAPQSITVNGKSYRTALRFERYYHPFSVTLLKATHEVYRGTDIPRNFQSRVRVDNPGTGEHREVDIYMNNPLRYAGLTFYQYQMGQAEAEGRAGSSTLEVVRNPSWLTPYFGCALVALGMIYQFLFHLINFIAKRRAPRSLPEKPAAKRRPPALAAASSNT